MAGLHRRIGDYGGCTVGMLAVTREENVFLSVVQESIGFKKIRK